MHSRVVGTRQSKSLAHWNPCTTHPRRALSTIMPPVMSLHTFHWMEVSCSRVHSSIFLGLGDAEVAPGEESPQEELAMGVSREREGVGVGEGKIGFSLLQTAQALAADFHITQDHVCVHAEQREQQDRGRQQLQPPAPHCSVPTQGSNVPFCPTAKLRPLPPLTLQGQPDKPSVPAPASLLQQFPASPAPPWEWSCTQLRFSASPL